MILVVAIVSLFVGISIFLYFRVENLQQQLVETKKESRIAQKEAKALVENLVHVANKQQEFAKFRWQKITDKADEELHKTLQVYTPLMNYYGFIFRECFAEKGKLQVAVKKCYDSVESGLYNRLLTQMKALQPQLRRQWNTNNIIGYMALVEGLISYYQTEVFDESNTSQTSKIA